MSTLKSADYPGHSGLYRRAGPDVRLPALADVFPDPARTPPAAAGLPQAEEVTLTSADGERLVAWHVPPQGAKPIVIYFHGNAGALNLRANRFRWIVDGRLRPSGAVISRLWRLDGKAHGGGNAARCHGGLRFCGCTLSGGTHRPLGRSVGTGVAVALAAERPVGGLILDAPFMSAADARRVRLSFHTGALVHQGFFRSDERIGRVRRRFSFFTASRIRIVEIRFAENRSRTNEPKRMVRFPSGGMSISTITARRRRCACS